MKSLAASLLVAGLVLAPGASAATVDIGTPLSPAPSLTTNGLPGPFTLLTTAALGGASTASPVDGTVLSWQTVGWQGSGFRVRVLDRSGDTFAGAGTGPSFDIASTAPTGPIPVSLPIKKGEYVAVDTPASFHYAYRSVSGGASFYKSPPYPSGTFESPASNAPNTYVYLATVRYCVVPNVVGRAIVTARGSLASSDCTVGTVRKAKGKKTRKKRFVRSISVAPGTSVSDTAPIDLRLGKRPKKK